MKITEILSQHRRDFTAEIICEDCGSKEILKYGYDDRNYHDNVIPNMKCKVCGKSRNDLGITEEQTQTRYAEGYQI
ncbi:MAG: hypothetical protein WC067_05460 [Candidatus Methanomethylophilaceae archaeon]